MDVKRGNIDKKITLENKLEVILYATTCDLKKSKKKTEGLLKDPRC